ncbi:hypothetical protein E3N88_43195 [Mikania micrantha]|uniref:2Fe-2S ferredoxin-type domain-containing protein n=1 Tax=Mikania micrantha TaxID=192012 RepID=A0A5N6LFM6_9ASTR|nr:hypothetical protein E3N88_43195 [Mikania micrantha]
MFFSFLKGIVTAYLFEILKLMIKIQITSHVVKLDFLHNVWSEWHLKPTPVMLLPPPIFESQNLTFIGKNCLKILWVEIKLIFRTTAMATYKVKLIGPGGEENEFDAPDDSYILDSAESAGVELPYSCRGRGHAHMC